MATRPPKLGGIVAVLGFSLSCVGLLIYLWSAFGGPIPLAPTGYRFTAYYPDATQLIAETNVRMAGVNVGHVVNVTQDGQLTKALIEIDPADAPIPADTTSVLRRKTLLGEPFIQLNPGTPPDQGGHWLAEGAALPVGQTLPSVDLDEALRAFNPETRHNFRLVLHQLALGTKNEGSALNGALGNLRPTTQGGADVFGILASQDRAVHTLVRDSGTTLQALSERRGDLSSLIAAGNSVLSATASRNRALAETVRLLPGTLEQLRPTLDLANQVGTDAAPLVRELDPASRQLTPTVQALHDLAPNLRGTLQDLNPLLDAAPAGVPAFSATLNAARPLIDQARPALRDVVPSVEWLSSYKHETAAWVAKLGTILQSTGGSQGQHILRVVIPFTPEGLSFYSGNPLGSNRHNPYPKPGYLDQVGRPNLQAFDCENVGGLNLEPAPPCVPQGPFSFNGFLGDFPQVRRAP
jgi:phospholipid/cholesterol/gamma-HCH transport system substrate-binding protein